MADQPDEDPKETTTGDNLLLELARRYDVGHGERLPQARGRGEDDSNPVISVNHDACILCDRCVRACDDIQGNDVIGRTGKGYATRIAFDLNDPMGESTCVTCGECVAACPTGALVNKPIHDVPIRPREELKSVDTVCPYCGVGCALTYHVDEERGAIAFADGREQPGNQAPAVRQGPLRLGLRRLHAAPDDAADPRRPTRRARSRATSRARAAGRKRPGGIVDYDEVMPHFREATWEEALDLAASRLKAIHDRDGSGRDRRLRLGQVLQRGGLPLPEADPRRLRHQQRRPLHAAVPRLERRRAARGRRLRRGLDHLRRHHQRRRRDPRRHEHDREPPRRLVVLQAGAPARHQADRRRPAARAGRRPRRHLLPDQAGHRRRVLQRRACTRSSGSAWSTASSSPSASTNYGELAKIVKQYPPERAAQICGVDADTIREVARLWGEAGAGVIYWGMGISQHTTGTDNARCLIAMCSITGNVGKPGTGLHPLRGQNNVQGASDAGLIPMMFPDYQRVDNAAAHEKFEAAWGRELDAKPGLTVTEIVGSALKGGVRGMYMMGENPFLSDPNINKVRKALAALEFLVVQDIFLTETAEFADVVLPATSFLEKDGTYTNTDRRVQIGRKVLDPPGEARAGLGDHLRDLDPDRAADGVRLGQRGVRRDGRALARLRGPGVRQPRADRQALPERGSGALRRHRRAVRRVVRDRRRQGAPRARRVDAGEGAAGRGVPVRAQHRPPARALAHRLDDAALVRARRDPADGDGVHLRGDAARAWASPTATSCA